MTTSRSGGPPGSAGVPPACTPVAFRSVSLRFGPRPPCRRERHGSGPGRALVRLPVESVGEEGPGCAENTAEETPHPGARASRPHALPQRTAQNACDGAPANPAGRNGVNPAKAEPWRDCRSSRVGEEGQAVPRQMRARRPRSRVGVPLRSLRSLHGTAGRPCHFRCPKPCNFRCPLTNRCLLFAAFAAGLARDRNDPGLTPGATLIRCYAAL